LTSSIFPLFLDLAVSGVKSVTLSSGGTGYASAPTVTFTGGSGFGASAITTVLNGVVTSVIMINHGQGYTSAPTVAFVSSSGAGAAGTASVGTGTITANTNILSTNLLIANDLVKPGGGATIRLSFGMVFGTSPAAVSIFNGGLLKGKLNADNSNNLITDGYYRFDLDVESGDLINFQASESITTLRFLKVQLVQVGA